MAILDAFTINVVIADTPATEYDDEDAVCQDHILTSTKYIEGVSNAIFAFKIHVSSRFDWRSADSVIVRAYIDGKQTNGILLYKSATNPYHGYTTTMNGIWTGTENDARLLKYTFADMQTNDTKDWKALYGDLGLLEIRLFRAQKIDEYRDGSEFTGAAVGSVPEKALKGSAVDITTSFKSTKAGRRPNSATTKEVDGGLFAKFQFKYRTHRALQSLMILERSPSPTPLEERDPETLTRDELIELERRRRAAEAIKKEHITNIKRERAASSVSTMPPLKTTRGNNGKVIYHIDSDSQNGNDDDDEVEETEPPAREEPEVITLL